jgi:hypothetical protein
MLYVLALVSLGVGGCALWLGGRVPSLKYEDVGVSGLWTNPNPELKRPPGALSRADEVVFRRPGMAEPRPGFRTDDGETGLDRIGALISYRDSLLAVGPAGDDTATTWRDGTRVSVDEDERGNTFLRAVDDVEDLSTDPAWDAPDNVRGIEARGNLYLTTLGNVRKLSSTSDTAMRTAGLIPPNIAGVTVAGEGDAEGTAVEDGMTVAYQAVLERKDANGVIVQSAPSGRYLYKNSSGSAVATRIGWHARGALEGDTLKIYRTAGASAGVPDNDLALVIALDVTPYLGDTGAGDIVTGVIDAVSDANRGELLYTSDTATNGGIQRANARPPVCRDLALYKQSLFFVGVATPAIKVVRYVEATNNPLLTAPEGIGIHTRTGTRTHNSAQITGLAHTDYLRVGMLIYEIADWDGDGPVQIVSIDSSSAVTMSQPWGGSTDSAPAAIAFVDAIQVGGTVHPAHLASALIQSVNAGFDPTGTVHSPVAFARGLGDDGQTGPVRGLRAVSFEALSTGYSFAVRATHGELYDPPLPEIDGSDPNDAALAAVEPNDVPNGYAWSKADEPEHALLLVRRVGNTTPILRSLVARDAIWMLKGKGDGIYRTSGFGELSGWRDDLFDASTYLLHPRLATVLDDQVYAWTNKGAVEISDAGVRVLSAPITDLTADLEQTLDHVSGAGTACFAAADPQAHEVVFGLPPLPGDEPATAAARVLVYNALTDAWSAWFSGEDDALSAGVLDVDQRLLAFGTEDGAILSELGPHDAVRTADLRGEVTLYSVDDGWIVYSGGASVGDRIVQTISDTVSGRVLEVRDAGEDGLQMRVDGDPDRFTTGEGGAAQLYRAVTARLTWLPRKPGGGVVKRFESIVVHWDDTRGVGEWSMTLAGARAPEESSDPLVYTFEYQTAAQRRADTRVLVPREFVLDTQLYPTVQISQADARWRITGLTTAFSPSTGRVSR